MLREYLEAMRALWTQEEACYGSSSSSDLAGPLAQAGAAARPVLVGAVGTEKNFKWIARSADGWITTPRDVDILEPVSYCKIIWAAAGPRQASTDRGPGRQTGARQAGALGQEAALRKVLFGMPDRSANDAAAWSGWPPSWPVAYRAGADA